MRAYLPDKAPGAEHADFRRCCLTFWAAPSSTPLVAPPVVSRLLMQLRQQAAEEQFAIPAYCFLPDRLHLVLARPSEGAGDTGLRRGGAAPSVRQMVFFFRHRAATWYWQVASRPLWQARYVTRVVEAHEDIRDVCRRVLLAPVREGLARTIRDYPFSGSDTFRLDQLDRAPGRAPGGQPRLVTARR